MKISLIIKGILIGSANVIPGVSGGTIALILGVYEELLNSIKRINLKSLKLLIKLKVKEFLSAINFTFLFNIAIGILISLFTVAYLLKFLFKHYPIYVWSFFCGLILSSVLLIYKEIPKKGSIEKILFIIGTLIGIIIFFIKPLNENSDFFYLIFCGVIGISSMIIPGLSGSYLLLILGNYKLIMIDSVLSLNLKILLPVFLGVILGIIITTRILHYLMINFKSLTLSIINGFILGSLILIWPWKHTYDMDGKLIYTNKFGAFINNFGNILDEKITIGSYKLYFPEFNDVFFISFAIMIIGFISILILEHKKLQKIK